MYISGKDTLGTGTKIPTTFLLIVSSTRRRHGNFEKQLQQNIIWSRVVILIEIDFHFLIIGESLGSLSSGEYLKMSSSQYFITKLIEF